MLDIQLMHTSLHKSLAAQWHVQTGWHERGLLLANLCVYFLACGNRELAIWFGCVMIATWEKNVCVGVAKQMSSHTLHSWVDKTYTHNNHTKNLK